MSSVAPAKKYADLVLPEGGINQVAIDISDHEGGERPQAGDPHPAAQGKG